MDLEKRKKYWYELSGADAVDVGPAMRHIFRIVSSMIAVLEAEIISYIDYKFEDRETKWMKRNH